MIQVKKRLYTILLMLLACQFANAQFYVTGDNPAKAKWSFIETQNFKIIYPSDCDSLAKVYGRNLEKYRIALSRTSGYLPSGGFNKKMPVVMHAFNGANGSVAWAPKRMDLFTLPSAYDPEPLPWATQLAIHEGRHVSQMQFGMTKAMKPGNYIFGQMWNIAATLLYPGIVFMEGDAVATETALSPSGRGRTADFLNYYRVAFDQGVERSWQQWRFPSQRNYSPTYYALGYMAIGGMRYLYDIPDYMAVASEYASRRPYNLAAFRTAVKNITGKKFKTAFKEICDTLNTHWREDFEVRKPFIPYEAVTKEPKRYTDYESIVFVGNDIYAIKSGHLNTPMLVKIDPSQKESKVVRFASQTSELKTCVRGRIYWSEDQPHPRWTMKTTSRVKYLPKNGVKPVTVLKNENVYNPTPYLYGLKTAVVEYYEKGGSAVKVLRSGYPSDIYKAPDSLQVVQTAWPEGRDIYVTAISDNGYGIYKVNVDTQAWSVILEPQPVMVKDFKNYGQDLVFTCDRTGANELYHLNTTTGELTQRTSTKYGAEDFVYSPDGEYLYYTSQTLKGKQIFRTKTESLICRTVEFSDRYKYPIAEKITTQEKEAALKRDEELVSTDSVIFSKPKRYNKFTNAFNIHSWLPLYVSVDNVMNASFDPIYRTASLGVSGILQNNLSTARGEIGYSAHKDPYNKSKWRHSAHAKFTYSGWYPVLEFSVDFNDRAARQYRLEYCQENAEGGYIRHYSTGSDKPYIKGQVSAYIPFDFSNGAWFKGFIPQVSYTISNDIFNTSMVHKVAYPGGENLGQEPIIVGASEGKKQIKQNLLLSLRGYTMLGTSNSAVYPKWGFGLEIGGNTSFAPIDYFSPMGYVYAYGYIPGFVPQQGLKFSMTYQRKLFKKVYFADRIVNTLPRGFSKNATLGSYLTMNNTNMTNFTFDYAIPVFIGDLAIGGSFLYVKRMVLTPHFDFNIIENTPALFSAGLTLSFNLESVVFLTWPCSVGVTASYNGGFNNSFKTYSSQGLNLKRWFVGPVFSMSF